MASIFDKIDAAGQAAIAAHIGEAVAFIGMLAGEYSTGADPARPQQDTRAVPALSPRTGKVTDGIQGRGSSGTARTHQNSELWMTAADFEALTWRPKKDDIALIEPGAPGERRFKIMAVLPLHHGDVQIIMSETEA